MLVWYGYTRFTGMRRVINFLQPFPPAILAGIAILLGIRIPPEFTREYFCDTCDLHQAIKDVSTSYDALVDLFESFESFLRRLDI
jgi:hypothetical protein